MSTISRRDLYKWCRIPYQKLEKHPELRVPFRLCEDADAMGLLMARELADLVRQHNGEGRATRAILPCGPTGWYAPFASIVNVEGIDLSRLVVFHMDECLDWQGRELPRAHPYSFRGFMERHFYGPVHPDLAVPADNRHWPRADNVEELKVRIREAPIDITYGGWGHDGHVAYNQARRHPYDALSVDELRASTVRVQENNLDTILALAQRTFGAA